MSYEFCNRKEFQVGVERLEVRNYLGLDKISMEFTPLHALIGSSDVGKSRILRAVGTAAQVATGTLRPVVNRDFKSFWEPFNAAIDVNAPDFEITIHSNGTSYALKKRGRLFLEKYLMGCDVCWLERDLSVVGYGTEDVLGLPAMRGWVRPKLLDLELVGLRSSCDNRLGFSSNHWFENEAGFGLSLMYHKLFFLEDQESLKIQKDIQEWFPNFRRFYFDSIMKASMNVEFVGGVLHIDSIGSGLLYYMAYAVLPYVRDLPSILLIESPEKGLHPHLIPRVMQILRELSDRCQVIITTHSPLVVNEFRQEEVTLIVEGDSGLKAVPMPETINFEERSKIYHLGELWLSYMEGGSENYLVSWP